MAMIGQYEVRELLGEGGVGQVHVGFDTVLEREVAIKSLRPVLINDKNFVDRFRGEATSLARLNHPNITTLYSLLPKGRNLYMIMELVRGDTLDTVLKNRNGPLGVKESLAIIAQAADGLSYAHSMGVIHRDIKPANLMITSTGLLKIMDFGIARVRGSQRLTRDGSMVGTLAYMAPEQLRGNPGDERSDLYSLAIVLYELLTGETPFVADSDYDLMHAHINTRPRRLVGRVPGLHARVESALLRGLAKKPEQRYASVREFSDALGATALRMDAPTIVIEGTRLKERPTDLADAAESGSLDRVSRAVDRLSWVPVGLRMPLAVGLSTLVVAGVLVIGSLTLMPEIWGPVQRAYVAAGTPTSVQPVPAGEARLKAEREAARKREEERKLAEARAKQEADAKAAQLAAEKREEERKLAEARAKQEADAKAAQLAAERREEERKLAEARAKQEADAKAAQLAAEKREEERKLAEARAKQEADEKAAQLAAQKRDDEARQTKVAALEAAPAPQDACSREEDHLRALQKMGTATRDEFKQFGQGLTCERLRSSVVSALNQAPPGPVRPDVNLPAQVRAAQEELARLGCFGGVADGGLNVATVDAAKRYQAQQGGYRVTRVEFSDAFIAELRKQVVRVCPVEERRPEPTARPNGMDLRPASVRPDDKEETSVPTRPNDKEERPASTRPDDREERPAPRRHARHHDEEPSSRRRSRVEHERPAPRHAAPRYEASSGSRGGGGNSGGSRSTTMGGVGY
jgi:tRNA A-37 threonylcarbamoyl transferase component Bud32